MARMRRQDLRRLRDLHQHIERGGFPDLGLPHEKAGYRFSVGMAVYEDGRTQPWRENLGKEKLTAQYRARAMVDVWVSHIRDHGSFDDPVVPMIRSEARAEAWTKANPRMHNTVRTELGFLKDFFQWLSDKEKWLASADWRRWLRAESRNAHFDEDAEADVDKKVDVYAIEELAKVYAVAGKALRTWMCCALNFAWAQGEISSARSKHWKMQHQRVARFRGKRNPNARPVPGRWVAWPETWALTTARMAETLMDKEINPEQRAFLTRQNNRLVRVIRRRGKKPKRKDAVAEAWDIRSSLSLTADTIRRGNLRWRRKMRRLII
jgi:hypothetical protein